MSTDEHAQLVVCKDRKAGLIFFGIVHILAGFLLLICFAFALAGLAIAAAAPTFFSSRNLLTINML